MFGLSSGVVPSVFSYNPPVITDIDPVPTLGAIANSILRIRGYNFGSSQGNLAVNSSSSPPTLVVRVADRNNLNVSSRCTNPTVSQAHTLITCNFGQGAGLNYSVSRLWVKVQNDPRMLSDEDEAIWIC